MKKAFIFLLVILFSALIQSTSEAANLQIFQCKRIGTNAIFSFQSVTPICPVGYEKFIAPNNSTKATATPKPTDSRPPLLTFICNNGVKNKFVTGRPPKCPVGYYKK